MAELNPNGYDFKTFIDEFPLPQVVKVIEGTYGSEDELTLSALQVIHLHFLKNSETVKATDERHREFYLPLNSPAKVNVLPSSAYQEFYVSVKKLAEDFPTYVQACNDDSELQIEAGDVLELKEVTTNPHNERFLKCKLKCTNKGKQEVLIPFSYQAKFKTLGDFLEHSNLFLKEVVAKTPHFPVRVKFQDDILKTKRRDINAGCPTELNQLGTFTLKEEFVMKLVVATSCGANHGSKRELLTVPRDLNISVTPVLPGKNKRCDCQTEKIENFKINFNETSFRYGCNVIEGHLSKQGVIKKPIPRARNRVTPSVTQSSSGILGHGKQTVNNSLGFSSYPNFETHKEMTGNEDIVKKASSNQKQEDEYVDMSFASKICFDEPESSLIQQQRNNLTADATGIANRSATATSSAAAAAAAADDDDDDECGGGSGGIDGSGDGGSRVGGVPAATAADYDDGDSKNGPTLTTDIPSSNTFPEENDNTYVNDTPVNPWSTFIQQPSNQPTCLPGSTVEYPRDGTDDDLFQSGDGHLGLPPPVPTKQNCTTRIFSFHEEVEDVLQYEPMSGQVWESHHSNVQNRFKKTRQQMSDVGPSISHDSPPTSFPPYDPPVPASNPQTKSKKTKSKMRRNIEKMMLRSNLKKSKSTTDIMPSEDYQYVESIPEAKADKKTDLGEFLSRIQKPKKKGTKDVSPVDYLSTMTVDEVSESLKCLHLHRYVETFRANTVDGSLFLDLNDKMLDELQVTSELDRLKIRKLQTEGWTPKYQ